MHQYHDLLERILKTGIDKGDRTGTGTRSVFGHQMRFDLQKGFPLVTTKRVFWRGVVEELLWFLRGDTNQKALLDKNVTIWKEWGDEQGNLGPIYSHQWRRFGGKHENRPQPKPKLPDGVVANTFGAAYIQPGNKEHRLYATWQSMIQRCYNQENDNYGYYGGRGVFVCNRWLMFSNFVEDTSTLEGWEDKNSTKWSMFQLDKDILGDGFQYSPEACMWVSRSENAKAKSNLIRILQHDDGTVVEVKSTVEFYKEHGISQGNFSSMLRGERPKAGGWSLVKTIDPDQGFDQISWVINELRINPDSRRMIVSAWNPQEVQHMGLPPCHMMFQFYTRPVFDPEDGSVLYRYLDLQLYQRSADVFLGVPFNIASYALLLTLIAREVGMMPGEFVWTGGDTHLYANHHDQAREQLLRDPRRLPRVVIPDSAPGIFEIQAGDIELIGYDPHPAIKAEVSV